MLLWSIAYFCGPSVMTPISLPRHVRHDSLVHPSKDSSLSSILLSLLVYHDCSEIYIIHSDTTNCALNFGAVILWRDRTTTRKHLDLQGLSRPMYQMPSYLLKISQASDCSRTLYNSQTFWSNPNIVLQMNSTGTILKIWFLSHLRAFAGCCTLLRFSGQSPSKLLLNLDQWKLWT